MEWGEQGRVAGKGLGSGGSPWSMMVCAWALGPGQGDVSGRAWKDWGGVESQGTSLGFGVYLKPSLSLAY